MFSVRCPRHDGDVLLGPSDILSLEPASGGGFSIGYRCSCGYEGHWSPNTWEEPWSSRMAG